MERAEGSGEGAAELGEPCKSKFSVQTNLAIFRGFRMTKADSIQINCADEHAKRLLSFLIERAILLVI